MIVRLSKFILIPLLVFSLTACAWFGGKTPVRSTPESLYQKGQQYYLDGKYKQSIEAFQRLREEYPLSKYAISADLGIADSYFSTGNYLSAESYYNDFVDFHPTNENLPYVMYQIGLCHYNEMLSIDRDQTQTRQARDSFEKLISRFPSSKFSFMAEKKLRDTKRRIGEHEFYVGQFYFKRGDYQAALRRFEVVAEEYANLGMDYKVSYFLHETKKRLPQEKSKTD
ncbi:MAG: outer membrane protein assembly factor BamD [Syntrophobacterales bacterium]|nr:MAG: outer membrane protein assembly factor BamD [Syntrophobacterales bacterium]